MVAAMGLIIPLTYFVIGMVVSGPKDGVDEETVPHRL
jgi:hypothetical protein